MVHAVKVLERLLDRAVADVGAVEDAATGGSRAELVERLLARGDHFGIEGHSHVIVGAEQDRAAPVADSDSRAFDLFHNQTEWVGMPAADQFLAQRDDVVEFGEQIGHLSFRRSSASTSWPTVSISACRFIEMRTSNSSSILATKSRTVRLSHSRSWAKRVASVIATSFLLKGTISSVTLA